VGTQAALSAAPCFDVLGPVAAMHERAELNQCNIIMSGIALLPRPHTAAAGVSNREIQIHAQKARERVRARRARREEAQARQRAQRGSVILRARPAKDVDRAIGIETRFAQEPVTADRAQLGGRTKELAAFAGRRLPALLRVEIGARAQRQTENDEIV